MVAEQRRRVEDLMTRMIEEMDKAYLRRMQVIGNRFYLGYSCL